MEQRLNERPSLGFEPESEPVRVACTTMAFDNADVINLLRKRGQAIRSEDEKARLSIEEEINEVKEEQFEKLVNPCSIFMTFETEEGIKRALNMQKSIDTQEDL